MDVLAGPEVGDIGLGNRDNLAAEALTPMGGRAERSAAKNSIEAAVFFVPLWHGVDCLNAAGLDAEVMLGWFAQSPDTKYGHSFETHEPEEESDILGQLSLVWLGAELLTCQFISKAWALNTLMTHRSNTQTIGLDCRQWSAWRATVFGDDGLVI